mgnify:CR=1 FL=1
MSGRFFTSSWQFAEAKSRATGQPLRYAAGSRFTQSEVGSGDTLYIVSVSKGQLYLLGKMEVDRIVSYEEAEQILDEKPFDAPEHVFARRCTATRLTLAPLEITQTLRFISASNRDSLYFTDEGVLSGQTLRVVRRLTPESAALLDGILEELSTPRAMNLAETCEALESLLASKDSETSLMRLRAVLHERPTLAQLMRMALEPEQEEPVPEPVAVLPNPGRVWREEEDNRLLASFEQGRSIEELAVEHQRSRGGIQARLGTRRRLQIG